MQNLNLKTSITIIILMLSIIFISCSDKNDDIDWTEEKNVEISPDIVPVNIFGEPGTVDGMLVKIEGDNQWHAYPINFIEGFDFEPGYFYVLKVKITHLSNPPQDASNVEYALIQVLSKIQE